MKLSHRKENLSWRNSALGVSLIIITLGGGPAACLSDVELPDCLARGVACGGASGNAGVAGSASSNAGVVGDDAAGSAGEGDSDDAGAGGAIAQSTFADAGGVSGSAEIGGANAVGGGSAEEVVGGGAAGRAGGAAGGASGVGGSAGGAADGAGGAGGIAGSGGSGGGAGKHAPCVSCSISPPALPAPCQSNPYSTTLTVVGGTAPYAWRLVPANGQWSVSADPNSPNGTKAQLTGQPAGPTSLTVEATSADGRVVSSTFDVKPRSSCWFAYTALEAAEPRLQLLDPILNLAPPVAPAHNAGVYDFQFSPNGQYLAYRFGADATYPKGRHLAVVSLSAWTEKLLNFTEDAVTAFSWSKDSTVLAVTFQSGNTSYLGGVKLNPSGAPGFPTEVDMLVPTAAVVDSPLYWVDGSYLAFHATIQLDPGGHPITNPFQRRTPYYSSLSAAGFAPPVPFPNVNYPQAVFLQPAENGFFMTAASATSFYSLPSGAVARHQFADLIAPSGRFTAELYDDQLQVFDATESNQVDPQYSSAAGEDCPMLLAWAQGAERIACVADVESDPPGTTHGEVRLFDIKATSTLSMDPLSGYCSKDSNASSSTSSCGATEYDYTLENSEGQARAFSRTGRWFAFTTSAPGTAGGSFLYLADLNARSFALKEKIYIATSSMTSTSPTALAFSEDERYLLLQINNSLTAYELLAPSPIEFGSSAVNLSDELLTSGSQALSACLETYASAPARWCGSADRVLPLSWAPDSRYAAYRTPGKLIVTDLTLFPVALSHPLVAADCNQQCSGQFAFQPQP